MDLGLSIPLEKPIAPENRCKHCSNIVIKDYGSKKFFYCSLIRSFKTSNGFKKIKANDPACSNGFNRDLGQVKLL